MEMFDKREDFIYKLFVISTILQEYHIIGSIIWGLSINIAVHRRESFFVI